MAWSLGGCIVWSVGECFREVAMVFYFGAAVICSALPACTCTYHCYCSGSINCRMQYQSSTGSVQLGFGSSRNPLAIEFNQQQA